MTPSPRTQQSRLMRLLALIASVALIAVGCSPTTATAVASSGLERQPDGWRGLPIDSRNTMPDVLLQTIDGDEFALAEDTQGTPTLLFFGYTHCPDICPIHLAAIASAMQTAGVSYDALDVVFVSVDPQRDTPDRIAEYLAHFDRRMIGLHADLATIEAALASLRLSGPVVEGPDPRGEGDLIGHPAQVIGFDADGVGRRVWPFGARRSDWVDDLPRIVAEWS
ncbi:MAG: SCO family protein [Nitriliruptoraceae bacterium]